MSYNSYSEVWLDLSWNSFSYGSIRMETEQKNVLVPLSGPYEVDLGLSCMEMEALSFHFVMELHNPRRASAQVRAKPRIFQGFT